MRIATLFVILFGLTESVTNAGEDSAVTEDGLSVAKSDWPWWRGPNRDGIAAADQSPPLRWSRENNVLWKILCQRADTPS